MNELVLGVVVFYGICCTVLVYVVYALIHRLVSGRWWG